MSASKHRHWDDCGRRMYQIRLPPHIARWDQGQFMATNTRIRMRIVKQAMLLLYRNINCVHFERCIKCALCMYLNSISLMCGTIYEFKLECLSSSQLTEWWKSTKFCHESLRNNLRWRSEQFSANWLSAVYSV